MAIQSLENIGFVGLGVMGYPMARNLIEKLPESASLWIFDVSKEVLEKFAAATKKTVHICSSSKEVAENSVCIQRQHPRTLRLEKC